MIIIKRTPRCSHIAKNFRHPDQILTVIAIFGVVFLMVLSIRFLRSEVEALERNRETDKRSLKTLRV
ncbi:MAG TPA: hypothetical protein VLB68_18665 [Pyrinomonadaceae bacterium]|nr:hypothetical protein [Pyrinomonadaceae bacterium]